MSSRRFVHCRLLSAGYLISIIFCRKKGSKKRVIKGSVTNENDLSPTPLFNTVMVPSGTMIGIFRDNIHNLLILNDISSLLKAVSRM